MINNKTIGINSHFFCNNASMNVNRQFLYVYNGTTLIEVLVWILYCVVYNVNHESFWLKKKLTLYFESTYTLVYICIKAIPEDSLYIPTYFHEGEMIDRPCLPLWANW